VQRAIIVILFLLFRSFAAEGQDLPLTDTFLSNLPDTALVEEVEPEELVYFLKNYEVVPDTIIQRQVPDTVITSLKADDDFWYANKSILKTRPNQKQPLAKMPWFQTLLWLIIITGFAGFLIWYLSANQVGIFRKKAAVISEETGVEPGTDNIFIINYQREIDKAVRDKDFRLATRLMFLRLLKQLADKNIIHYKQDRTNLEYLQQLYSTNYYKDFFQATRNYEYSWYGKFPVSEEAFNKIRSEFDRFDKVLI
jgi:hypothetical protein